MKLRVADIYILIYKTIIKLFFKEPILKQCI